MNGLPNNPTNCSIAIIKKKKKKKVLDPWGMKNERKNEPFPILLTTGFLQRITDLRNNASMVPPF